MDVKQAVQIAKQYVSELFEGEPITNVGLEEVVYEDESDTWKITIGFSRPWHRTEPQTALPKCSAGPSSAPIKWSKLTTRVARSSL